MPRLVLPRVTLCAVTSVNVVATVLALQQCLDQAEFAECLLFTDAAPSQLDPRIRLVRIEPIRSSAAYSAFILEWLPEFITSSHVLIVQWDGFVMDARQWDPAFLSYDYIGAVWPQFSDGHNVGNGGFSLRSRKLLDAGRAPGFRASHPEDVAICRMNRSLLEREHGIRFADRATAARFSFEREAPAGPTFGFHGIFNMIPVLGADRFWEMYRQLDDRSSAFVDYGLLIRQLGDGGAATLRRVQLTKDKISALWKR